MRGFLKPIVADSYQATVGRLSIRWNSHRRRREYLWDGY
jgi:hypothetical protein